MFHRSSHFTRFPGFTDWIGKPVLSLFLILPVLLVNHLTGIFYGGLFGFQVSPILMVTIRSSTDEHKMENIVSNTGYFVCWFYPKTLQPLKLV